MSDATGADRLASSVDGLRTRVESLQGGVDLNTQGLLDETAARRRGTRTTRFLIAAVVVAVLVFAVGSVTVARSVVGAFKRSVCDSYSIDIPRAGAARPSTAVGIQKEREARARYFEKGCDLSLIPPPEPYLTTSPSAGG